MTFNIDAKPESPRLPPIHFPTMLDQMLPEGVMCNVFPILHVLFLQTKLKRATAKVWQ